jgi:hypothetical protein
VSDRPHHSVRFSPMWLSKWITLIAPQCLCVERSAESVVVWSPPRVMILGTEYSVELVGRPDTIFIAVYGSESARSLNRRSVDCGHAPCDWHQVASKPLCCPTRAGQCQAVSAMADRHTRNVSGASPQSTILAQSRKTFLPRRTESTISRRICSGIT